MKIAVGYVRCSTDEQGATSIPQQKEEILKWSKINEFEIIDWFVDEGKSGTSFSKRPGFCELVRQVSLKPQFHYVIAYDESRWGRPLNPRENSYWKMHLEMHNVKVRMVHSSSKNGDDIGSYVTEVVESAEASEYSRKLSRSTLRGMLSDQQGIHSRGGTAPYGHKRVVIDQQTRERRDIRDGAQCVHKQEKVVWDLGSPLEVATVKRIFDLKAEGLGFVSIADKLNGEGVSCPKRGRWKNLDQKWSGPTVATILKNPTYTGDRVYNRLSFSKFVAKDLGLDHCTKIVHDKSKWVVVPNAHPAIVSKELYEKVNKPINKPRTKPNQHFYRSTFLLTGLIKCVRCGFNYQGHNHKQSGCRYYVDGGFINKGKSVCSWFSIKQDQLESFVITKTKEIYFTKEFRKQTERYVMELLDAGPQELQTDMEFRRVKVADIELKMRNLLALAEKGVNLETVASRLKELEEQLKDLRGQNNAKPLPQRKIEPKTVSAAINDFIENFERNFEQKPQIERKELIRRLVEKIEVDPDKKTVKCYFRRLPSIDEVLEMSGGHGLLGEASSPNGNLHHQVQDKHIIDMYLFA